MKRWYLPGLVVILLVFVRTPEPAAAHPLGNFTVNQYSRIEVGRAVVTVQYIVDMAEIPAFQERQQIDGNSDGQISDAEAAGYAVRKGHELLGGLQLTVDGAPTPLRLDDQLLSFPPGQGGLPTLRLALTIAAPLALAQRPLAIGYRDSNFAERIGWREIIMLPRDGVQLSDASVPERDQSNGLLNYPQDLLSSPLDVREARATAAPVAPRADAPLAPAVSAPVLVRADDRFAALIAPQQLTPAAIGLSLLLALLLGAGHALTPGHGKTIVAAYLVGARGTARHALFLGITTTITHTIGVFALGLVTLLISNYILPEQLYPWLEFLSGALVLAIGAMLFRSRLAGLLRRSAHAHGHAHPHDADHAHGHAHPHDADHAHGHAHPHDADHAHDHAHPHDADHTHHHGLAHSHMPPGADGQPITWRGLLALGVSGGLLPCPSALVVLLSAIALHRVALGMLLIVMFSIGLATVLTGIGMLLVYARQLFERFPSDGRLLRALPLASAAVVTIAGAGIALQALLQAGLLPI